MILLDINPEEFFTRASKSSERPLIFITKELEYYLAQLLSSFAYPKSKHASRTNIFETPLALVHKRALESEPKDRIKLYRELGDHSLYVGVFRKA